eukprot:6720325-Alexandrium_andersonii.AAC.1
MGNRRRLLVCSARGKQALAWGWPGAKSAVSVLQGEARFRGSGGLAVRGRWHRGAQKGVHGVACRSGCSR